MESLDQARDILMKGYRAFNDRDADTALSLMHPDVRWANGMEGGVERGLEAVRHYWNRQWGMVSARAEPISFDITYEGDIHVKVDMKIRDLDGLLKIEQVVDHVYRFKEGLIISMEIW